MKKATKRLAANIRLDKNETLEFLRSEYEQCFAHMRHYDSVGISFASLSLTGYVALASGVFALFKYLEGIPSRDIIIGLLLMSMFLIGLISLSLMVRNRVYYVIVAKQVNSIRNYFLNNTDIDFIKYNRCYTDPNYPRALNPTSTYSLMFALVALLNAALSGIGSYLVLKNLQAANVDVGVLGIVIGVILLIGQLTAIVLYLHRSDRLVPTDEKLEKEPEGSKNG